MKMTVNTLKVRLQHDEIYSKHFFKDSYCMPCPGSNLVTRNSHSKVWENEIRIKFLSVCSLTSAQSYCSKFRLTRSRRLHFTAFTPRQQLLSGFQLLEIFGTFRYGHRFISLALSQEGPTLSEHS